MARNNDGVDFETILRRIGTWSARLDREYEAAVASSRASRRMFADLEATVAKLDKRDVINGQQVLEAQLEALPPAQQPDLLKPSVFQLASAHNVRLIRA
jgi:hypothetical protein